MIAEATAMRNAIRAVVQAGYTNIHIEGITKSSFKQFTVTFKRHGNASFDSRYPFLLSIMELCNC